MRAAQLYRLALGPNNEHLSPRRRSKVSAIATPKQHHRSRRGSRALTRALGLLRPAA